MLAVLALLQRICFLINQNCLDLSCSKTKIPGIASVRSVTLKEVRESTCQLVDRVWRTSWDFSLDRSLKSDYLSHKLSSEINITSFKVARFPSVVCDIIRFLLF